MNKQMTSALAQGHNTPVVLVGCKENEILSEEQAVSRLGIDGLTELILYEWFIENGFCKIMRFPYQPRRVLQPTQKFFEYTKIEGYTFNDKEDEEVELIYSANLVEILAKEFKSDINDFVKKKITKK